MDSSIRADLLDSSVKQDALETTDLALPGGGDCFGMQSLNEPAVHLKSPFNMPTPGLLLFCPCVVWVQGGCYSHAPIHTGPPIQKERGCACT